MIQPLMREALAIREARLGIKYPADLREKVADAVATAVNADYSAGGNMIAASVDAFASCVMAYEKQHGIGVSA